jgi:hypothetical protein
MWSGKSKHSDLYSVLIKISYIKHNFQTQNWRITGIRLFTTRWQGWSKFSYTQCNFRTGDYPPKITLIRLIKKTPIKFKTTWFTVDNWSLTQYFGQEENQTLPEYKPIILLSYYLLGVMVIIWNNLFTNYGLALKEPKQNRIITLNVTRELSSIFYAKNTLTAPDQKLRNSELEWY